MVRLAAAAAAAVLLSACGAAAITTDQTPSPSNTPAPSASPTHVNDRPNGADGAPAGAPAPPHFCGDQLCVSPTPTQR